ncbi:hypothetical protein TNCV_4405811 [Trichonephila clavipes]|uniref:Uncharacterized protein n=1 Tax=Trichonephila clavipes TaxID=2585209 RepID=A0A8X6SCG4_TRICX|nr:hypothetical protein TNCV_4405811 [Trichonephila clavipes]
MSNVRDDWSACGPTWHVPSSSSSWITIKVMDYIKVYRPSLSVKRGVVTSNASARRAEGLMPDKSFVTRNLHIDEMW